MIEQLESGAVYIKIVPPLCPLLTEKNILFPCVHVLNISPSRQDLFSQTISWENFVEN